MPVAERHRTARRADPFASLNDAQRVAVGHGVAPLLVIAGAGTGKTTTLVARVARLVLDGADPQRLLLLTFSRRAAQEMTQRAGRMLHAALGLGSTTAPPALPWAGTFHAIGARLLRDHAAAIGLPDQFTILDRADAEDLMAIVRQAAGLAETAQRFPLKGTCLAIYSRVVNAAISVDDALREHFPWCLGWEAELKGLFRAYVQAKQDQHVLDYDDLLLYWHAMLEEPVLAQALAARFEHVLVDEYQDTNRLQAAILQALCPDGRGLTVVGDDAQAIYSFRAAEVRNILDFPSRFSPPARVVTLEHNFRSTQSLLDASNAVIAMAAERYAKDLVSTTGRGERPRLVAVDDEMAQARWVADEVLRQREEGLQLKQQAVLFRTGHHSAALELELVRRDIPFVKYGGLKFLEAAHVKDLLSVLRWVQNPRHRLAGFRVAQLVPGIGPAGARRLLDAIEHAADPCQAMHDFAPPAAAAHDWRDWLAAYEALCSARWPDDVALAMRWYRPHLERLHDDAALRLRQPRALPRRTDARPARGHQRRGRHAAPRRRLARAVDRARGQGPGVDGGVRAQRRRRLHAGRHGHRQRRADRGGAPAALRRDDTRQTASGAAGAATLSRHAAAAAGRPASLWLDQSLRAAAGAGPVRLAAAEWQRQLGGSARRDSRDRTRRPDGPDARSLLGGGCSRRRRGAIVIAKHQPRTRRSSTPPQMGPPHLGSC